jgi:hypothetical protein
MASLAQIFDWFKTGLKPTEDQFRQTFESFFHKSEQIENAVNAAKLGGVLASEYAKKTEETLANILERGSETQGRPIAVGTASVQNNQTYITNSGIRIGIRINGEWFKIDNTNNIPDVDGTETFREAWLAFLNLDNIENAVNAEKLGGVLAGKYAKKEEETLANILERGSDTQGRPIAVGTASVQNNQTYITNSGIRIGIRINGEWFQMDNTNNIPLVDGTEAFREAWLTFLNLDNTVMDGGIF